MIGLTARLEQRQSSFGMEYCVGNPRSKAESVQADLLRVGMGIKQARRGLVKLCMLLVFVCVTLAWTSAQTDALADAESKIAALEQLWNLAYKARDTTALGSILDDAICIDQRRRIGSK